MAHLQQLTEAPTSAALAEQLRLHPNTVREHLDVLIARGHVERFRAAVTGRGRPAWRYRATNTNREPDPRVREYVGLAGALADHILRTSADPASDALAAGEHWAHSFGSAANANTSTRDAGDTALDRATDRVVARLDDLGFSPDAAPSATATTVALRSCPLLDAAREHPEVICNVHLGLVRGTLQQLASPVTAELRPFDQPGACSLHLQGPPADALTLAQPDPGGAS